MNSIREIPLQNQQDFWSMLYLYLGKNILQVCGRKGEQAIRQALQKLGTEDGLRYRQACLDQGCKTNLRSLFAMGCACSNDPRVRTTVRCDQEQVHLWETYTCPLADLWQDHDQAFLGNFYCEDYQWALIRAYTDGAGQFHTTKKLLCHRTNGCRPDNHCCFAAYYRPANVGEEQRAQSFSEDGGQQAPLPVPFQTYAQAMTAKCIRTVKYLAEAAEEHFGSEGLNAVALGLRELVQPTADMMRHDADATLSADLADFTARNLPVRLDTDDDSWVQYGDERSRRLFHANFSTRLSQALSLPL